MERERETSTISSKIDRRRGIARGFLFKILFPVVIAFSLCHSLTALMGWVGEDDWRKLLSYDYANRKLARFVPQKDDFDLIFLGSSLTYRGINPEVFDQTLADSGIENRSFNFGNAVNYIQLTKAILELSPKRLKWVILDINTGIPETRFRNQGRPLWRAFEEIDFISRHILAMEDSLLNRLTLLGFHWHEFLKKITASGRAAEWLFEKIQSSIGAFGREANKGADGLDRTEFQGFRPLDWEVVARPKLDRELFLAESSRYLEEVPMVGREQRGQKPSVRRLAMFQEMKALLQKSNINLVLFVPSSLGRPSRNLEYSCLNGMYPMLDLRSSEKYPELYTLDHRFDAEHVNEAGATIQSQTLAKEFGSQIKNIISDQRAPASGEFNQSEACF